MFVFAINKAPWCQQGVALIVSLLILLVLTLIGITAIMVSSLEERMSGNLKDRNLAFQAAESALRAGELAVDTGLNAANQSTFGCTSSTVCSLSSDVSPSSSVWTGDSSRSVEYTASLPNVTSRPKYLIEVLTPAPISLSALSPMDAGGTMRPQAPQCYYRITALGFGGTSTAKVVLQSTYVHPLVKGVCHG